MDQLVYHGYCYGTAIWYFLRGACRIYDPKMVIDWFRPPSQISLVGPNDLEIYNIYNDAWGLIAIGLVLLGLSAYSTGISPGAKRALVLTTVFHHATTAVGAYDHYRRASHYTTAMGIGVWVNVYLALVGLGAAALAPGSAEAIKANKKLN